MARRPLSDDGLVHGQGAAALLRSIQEYPRPHPTPMEKHLAAKRKTPEPDPVDALIALKAKAGVRLTTKSIINTATRGDEDKQRIATPWAFIRALEHRFGCPVDFDLAAEEGNAKAPQWFGGDLKSDGVDALTQDWSDLWYRHPAGDLVPVRLAYLNPPYANIRPWALSPKDNPKAGLVACRWLRRWTVMLVPASYSTDWFLELRGLVQLDAIPRIQFEGATHLYPKDLVLCVAGFGVTGMGYWDWRVSYLQSCLQRGVAPEPVHARGCSALIKAEGVGGCLPDFHNSPDPFCLLQVP